MTTVSLFPILILLNSPDAMRVSALIGSPCDPVEMITSSLSFIFLILSISITRFCGIFSSPILEAASATLIMLRPENTTFRRYFTAISKICCSRWTLDAKVAIIRRRPILSEKMWSNVSPTTRSLIV